MTKGAWHLGDGGHLGDGAFGGAGHLGYGEHSCGHFPGTEGLEHAPQVIVCEDVFGLQTQ